MDFFVNNWAQISFILLAIGYIVKIILDSTFKRKEIKFNFFLNNRMKAIESFLSSYANLESNFRDSSTSYFNKIMTATEIDGVVVPLRYKLTDALAILQLYTTKTEFEKFTEVYDNFMLLMNNCSRLKFEPGIDDITRSNHLNFILVENKIKNGTLLNKLTNQIQKDVRY